MLWGALLIVLHVDLAVAVVVLQLGHDVRVAAVEEDDQAINRSPRLPPQLLEISQQDIGLLLAGDGSDEG